MFALNRGLPDDTWSGLALDYADLAGADLSRMSFKGSSLRGASLDNVRMVGTDLRDADLTGVQLEQTEPVVALAFDADSNTAYAAYKDRSIRRWTLGAGGRTSCTTLAAPSFQPQSLHLSPFGDLIVMGTKEIAVLSPQGADDAWGVVATFPRSDYVDLLSINGYDVTLHGKDGISPPQLVRYDPIERTFREYATAGTGIPPGRLFLLGENMTLAGTSDGIVVSVRGNRRHVALPRATCLDIRQLSDDQALLAAGHEDGAVSLWHLHSLRTQPKLDRLWCRDAHAGSVTDVRASGMFVLSGGIDRTICLFALGDGWSTSQPLRLHRTLECTDMRIDGICGPRERARLAMLLSSADAHPRPEHPRAPRPTGSDRIPTPAEVFGTRPRR